MKTGTGKQGWLVLMAMVMVLLPAPRAGAQEQRANRAAGEQQFFETLNDVPLMPGLYEMLGESVVFDKPEGRIIESSAASEDLARKEIHNFYDKTLPQLGWARIGKDKFVRQGELLTMNIEDRNGYKIVHFMVSPR